jgi:hypothetical protein
MNNKKLSQWVLVLILSLTISSCAPGQIFGPTPTPGVGVPVSDGKWDVTLLLTFLSRRLNINEDNYAEPKDGTMFLIAEVSFKNKNDPENKIIHLNELSLLDTNGNKIVAIGNIDWQLTDIHKQLEQLNDFDTYYDIGCTNCEPISVEQGQTNSNNIVFVIPFQNEDENILYKFQFRNLVMIPFISKWHTK